MCVGFFKFPFHAFISHQINVNKISVSLKKENPKFFIRRNKEKAYGYVGKAYGDPYGKTKQNQNKVNGWTPEVQHIRTFGGVLPVLF